MSLGKTDVIMTTCERFFARIDKLTFFMVCVQSLTDLSVDLKGNEVWSQKKGNG